MKARVTEKLIKNRDMVILKHQSCIITGWILHPADRLCKKGCERFLTNLPLCIFCKFQDATWVLDERLGVGIWPLYPVERTWILNEALQTKIKRKGFTLVPDYASTAFMIQGATIPAGIADCGDVTDCGGFSELMTTYVILSRVKSADGLLLLRAFCPNMFAMGALPGPTCLLKLLRYKFSGSTHESGRYEGHVSPGTAHDARQIMYTAEAAAEEYQSLMAIYDAWRVQCREFGPDWRCCDCGMFSSSRLRCKQTRNLRPSRKNSCSGPLEVLYGVPGYSFWAVVEFDV